MLNVMTILGDEYVLINPEYDHRLGQATQPLLVSHMRERSGKAGEPTGRHH